MKQLAVLFLVTQVLSQELNSTLHSTLYGIQVAYVGEIVTFTCVVRQSNSMGWMSEEYIGTGGQQLEISAADPINTPQTAIGDNQTVATLTSAIVDKVIISQLRVKIKPGEQTASIQCRNIGDNTITSTTFLLADAASVTCDRHAVCSGEAVTCTCTTGDSNTLVWTTNGDRFNLSFTSTDSPLTMRNVTGSSTFSVLVESSDRNGVRVIMSNITVGVPTSSTDTKVILTCENANRARKKTVILPVVDNCPVVQVVTPAESKPQRGSSSYPISAAVAPAVLLFAALLGILIATIVVLYKYISLRQEYNQKVKEYEAKGKKRGDEESDEFRNMEKKKDREIMELPKTVEHLKEARFDFIENHRLTDEHLPIDSI